jgi:hypothetical protein
MRYSCFNNALTVGIILLFIGVGIQPAFADVSNISISDSEDDCEICPKINNQYLIKIKSFIDKLEKHDNILSISTKLNPEFVKKYQELSNYIDSNEPIFIRPFCVFLEILRYFFIDLGEYFINRLSVWMPGEHGLLYYIIPAIACFSIAILFQIVGVGIFCWTIQ